MAPKLPSLVLAMLSLVVAPGCRKKDPTTKRPDIEELRSKLRLATDAIAWLYQGKAAGLSDLFNQRAATTMSPSKICRLTTDEWDGMTDALISAHSDLIAPGETAIRSALARKWVTVTPANLTEISFSQRSLDAGASVRAVFARNVASAEVGSSVKKSDVVLVVADRRKTATLSADMVECVLANICIDNPDGGEYIRTLHYGSLIWMDINENNYDVTVTADALRVLSIRGHLDSDSLSITGGLVGSFSGPSVGDAYGTQVMIDDISSQDIIRVQRGIRKIADSVDIIGQTTERYTSQQCSDIFATIEKMP